MKVISSGTGRYLDKILVDGFNYVICISVSAFEATACHHRQLRVHLTVKSRRYRLLKLTQKPLKLTFAAKENIKLRVGWLYFRIGAFF